MSDTKEVEDLESGLEAGVDNELIEVPSDQETGNPVGGDQGESDDVDHTHMEKEEIQEIFAFQKGKEVMGAKPGGGEVIDIEEMEEQGGVKHRQQMKEHGDANEDERDAAEADDESDGEERGEILSRRKQGTNIKGHQHQKPQAGGDQYQRHQRHQKSPERSDESGDSVTPGLPSILLEYDQQFFFLFNDPEEIQTDDVLFYGDNHLLNSTIALFIRSLKSAFEINADVTIEFPQLELSFPQDLVHAKSIKVRTLVNFHEALQVTKGISAAESQPLKIVMFNHQRSLVQQYNKLLNVLRIGGRAQNPIVLSDEEEVEGEEPIEEIEGKDEDADIDKDADAEPIEETENKDANADADEEQFRNSKYSQGASNEEKKDDSNTEIENGLSNERHPENGLLKRKELGDVDENVDPENLKRSKSS